VRSIFWKIFLSFWLVMVLIVGISIAVSFQVADRWAEDFEGPGFWETLTEAQAIFNEGGLDQLKEWVSDPTNFPLSRTVYVLDSEGRDFLGRDLPHPLKRRAGFWRRGARGEGLGGPRGPFSFRTNDGTEYLAMPGPAPYPVLGVFGTPSLRWTLLLAAILISALACFALTRYLTRPLHDIARAAESLAEGNLSSRVGSGAYRSDEIGTVSSRFDAMAEQLERFAATRQELLRNISHELRSPLARIQVAVELAERQPERASEYLARIEQEATDLERLTQQVLGLARLQESDREPGQVDLIEVVDAVAQDATFEGKGEQKTVNWTPPEKRAIVKGDRQLIGSAIENVVRNALRHTAPGSEVIIDLAVADDTCRLRVRDQGPGVPDDQLEDIFEPFYRASETDGVGVGLAITHRVVSLMNGQVSARNEGGLVIEMKFPGAPKNT